MKLLNQHPMHPWYHQMIWVQHYIVLCLLYKYLGQLSLRLAESFRSLAEDTQIAQNLMNSPELGQRLKAGVQKV